MRKQPTLLLLLSTVILMSWGCGQSEQSAAPPSPPPAPAPGTTPPAPPPQANAPAATPTASPSSSSSDLKSFGLIPATNPKQRQQEIAVGRSNPFSLIAIQPKVDPGIAAIQATTKKPSKPNLPNQKVGTEKTNKLGSKTVINKQNKGKAEFAKGNPKKYWNSGKGMPPHTIAKSLPPAPPPPPTEAKAVEVSGVIAIGSTPFAIIQAPGESVPRYVSPGDSVANGQVRVVSINNNAEIPTVTLEQYGQTVTREVGAPPEGSVLPAQPGSAPLEPTAS